MTYDYFSIEPDSYGEFNVYGWGIYGSESVLEGQQKKAFITDYPTVAEALVAYPDADVHEGVVSANNSFGHLPDREMSAYEEEGYWQPEDW